MSIQEHLNKIRNAVYGHEVRESIAKGIETAYDDASEKDNANMEVTFARGTHPNLRSRLEEVDNKQQQTTTQLAQKANENEVRKKSEPIGLNDASPELLSAIEGGEGTSFNLESVPRDYSVTHEKTTFANLGKNLFNGEFVHAVLAGTPPTGQYQTTATGYTILFKGEKGKTYTITKGTTADRFRVGANVGKPVNGQTLTRYIANYDAPDYRSVTLQGDEDYIVIYLSSETQNIEPLGVQIEEGSTKTIYEPYGYVKVDLTEGSVNNYHLKEKTITINKLSDEVQSKLNLNEQTFYITDSLEGEYEPTFTFIDPYDFSITVDDIHAIYDDLVTRYPNYVTRTLLGNEPTGLPIYQYEFKPPQITGMNKPIPKVAVMQGIHGMEKPASFGGSRFWVDLCDNWKTNKLLRALRWNVHFVVIPIANPYSFNAGQRKNANGVDIARNFSDGWNQIGNNGNPESMYYAGTAPMSEVETQILDAWMDTHSDSLWAIDLHNYTSLSVSGTLLWTGSSIDYVNQFSASYVQMMSSIAHSRYTLPSEYEGKALGMIQTTLDGGSATNQWISKGVNASILELVVAMNNSQPDIQDLTCSGLGNYILTGLRHLI